MNGARNLKLRGQRRGGARARAQEGNKLFVGGPNVNLISVAVCIEKMQQRPRAEPPGRGRGEGSKGQSLPEAETLLAYGHATEAANLSAI